MVSEVASDSVCSLTASLRYDLVEAGAMSALANSLSYSDSSVQHATAGALAVLGCDNTARVKVTYYTLT